MNNKSYWDEAVQECKAGNKAYMDQLSEKTRKAVETAVQVETGKSSSK